MVCPWLLVCLRLRVFVVSLRVARAVMGHEAARCCVCAAKLGWHGSSSSLGRAARTGSGALLYRALLYRVMRAAGLQHHAREHPLCVRTHPAEEGEGEEGDEDAEERRAAAREEAQRAAVLKKVRRALVLCAVCVRVCLPTLVWEGAPSFAFESGAGRQAGCKMFASGRMFVGCARRSCMLPRAANLPALDGSAASIIRHSDA